MAFHRISAALHRTNVCAICDSLCGVYGLMENDFERLFAQRMIFAQFIFVFFCVCVIAGGWVVGCLSKSNITFSAYCIGVWMDCSKSGDPLAPHGVLKWDLCINTVVGVNQNHSIIATQAA